MQAALDAVSSTRLYHVPLSTPTFTVGKKDILVLELPLKAGLLSTVQEVERVLEHTPSKVIRQLAPLLDIQGTNPDKIRRVIVAEAQMRWYESKGSSIPQKVVDTHNNALREANVVETQVTSSPETTESGSTTVKDTTAKTRAGTRPYCRSLIEAGETDVEKLLAAVHAQFPDKTTVFKKADVNGCLRNAGVKEWTPRKGAKKNAA